MMDFVAWPKIPRLKKGMVVTEKLDGTNAAIIVERLSGLGLLEDPTSPSPARVTVSPTGSSEKYVARSVVLEDDVYLVGAQSRNRLITPEMDNAGFAAWVFDHAEILASMLGQGHHYGEWWGQGIQRRYGMDHKVFSLFNTHRYTDMLEAWRPSLEAEGIDHQLRVVPHLYAGDFSIDKVDEILTDLFNNGSYAVPGRLYKNPEGVVIYHSGAGTTWKAFCDPATEAKPKGETKADYKLAAPAGG
jgi:hypothetical protein